jgi:phage shock protein C
MEAPQPDSPTRKLTRSRDNRWLAGVCGGLAKYFNLDPVIFRILFVLLAFTGAGIPIYLIAWLIIPAEGEPESIGDSLVRKAREGRKS